MAAVDENHRYGNAFLRSTRALCWVYTTTSGACPKPIHGVTASISDLPEHCRRGILLPYDHISHRFGFGNRETDYCYVYYSWLFDLHFVYIHHVRFNIRYVVIWTKKVSHCCHSLFLSFSLCRPCFFHLRSLVLTVIPIVFIVLLSAAWDNKIDAFICFSYAYLIYLVVKQRRTSPGNVSSNKIKLEQTNKPITRSRSLKRRSGPVSYSPA